MAATIHMDDAHIDAGVPWHYGEPLKEQRLMSQMPVRIDLSHKEVVTVTGPDRLTWLNDLTTQDLLAPFTSTQALILSPHGHIEHDLHVISEGETVWLIVEPGTAAALTEYLIKMRFMLRVEIENKSSDYAIVGASGWAEDTYPTWHSSPAYLDDFSDKYVQRRPASWQITEFVVPRDFLNDALAGHDLVGTWAWEAARIRAAVPRLNLDTDHKTIPHEVGLISAAVHLHKGCYRGQETIARVYNLGKPPRRLVQLELDGSTNSLPAAGTGVFHGETQVGTLTSVVQDFEHGPLGLAVIKRSTPVDITLVVGEVSANQTEVVA
jgi:folate-binding protein YgfZ